MKQEVKEKILSAMQQEDEKVLKEMFFGITNNFGFNKKEVAAVIREDETANSLFEKICIAWLNVLFAQKANQSYDGRNEYSVKAGSTIYLALEDNALMSITNMKPITLYRGNLERTIGETPDLAAKFAYISSEEHRTLQQTFSSLVFYYLANHMLDDETRREIETELEYESWYNCPFI